MSKDLSWFFFGENLNTEKNIKLIYFFIKMVMYHKTWFSGEYISMETKQLVKSLRYLNANRLLLDLNGGHDSHQNLWMTYEDSNGTGLQSLETITVFYTSFLVGTRPN